MRVLISGRSALVFIREEEWGTSRGASALSRRCDYGGVRAEMGPILLPVDSRQRWVCYYENAVWIVQVLLKKIVYHFK